MTTREKILEATHALVADHHAFPSLDAVATASGVSKGGLMHHFRTRTALIEGLVQRELERVDTALTEAAARGAVARTWLTLSSPAGEQVALYRAMDVVLTALSSGGTTLVEQLAAATARWDALLTQELDDPNTALLVRLVGDGLLLNAISGTPPDAGQVAAVTRSLLGGRT